MIKVGIIGATGYTGAELIRSILSHPEMELSYIAAASTAGEKFSNLYPGYTGKVDLVVQKYDIADMKKMSLDVMFIALPHGHSMNIVPELYKTGIKIVDLGADFRLKNVEDFKEWYKTDHTAIETIPKATYGLPEKYRDQIKKAQLVANPGCYTTASILGLWPLSNAGIEISSIIIDAKSGVSGAGKKLSEATHYSNCNEGVMAYKVLTHQHTPEIVQEVGEDLVFVPHLIPMTRGIISTMYINTDKKYSEEEIRKIFEDYYKDEPFVQFLDNGKVLNTKMVFGSNNCFLQVYLDKIKKTIVVTSVIDNLIKGAAGQAIQNCNIMFGFSEYLGLGSVGLYP